MELEEFAEDCSTGLDGIGVALLQIAKILDEEVIAELQFLYSLR